MKAEEGNTVAIIIDSKGHYRLFDSHSCDMHGNIAFNGTAVLLEFNTIDETVQYVQHFYRAKSVVAFEVLGIEVKSLSGNSNCRDTSYYRSSVSSTSTNDTSEFNWSCGQRSNLYCKIYGINDNQKRVLDEAPENEHDEPGKYSFVNMKQQLGFKEVTTAG